MSDSTATDTGRVKGLHDLKEFAVQRGYNVSEKLLKDIAEVEHKFLRIVEPASMTSEQISNVDRLTIELSQITYPVTTFNVEKVLSNSGVTRFVYIMLAFGLCAALGAGFASSIVKHNNYGADIAQAVLPLTLGFVGAIVYVMLPNGRLNVVAGLDAENKATDIVRVVMGGSVGLCSPVCRPSCFGTKFYKLLKFSKR